MQKSAGSINNKATPTGTVVAYFGHSVAVEDAVGQVFQCHLRRNQDSPVVGDEVDFMLDLDKKGVIVAIHPRRSLLAKGDKRGDMKPVVANVDLILIVMAPPPIFSNYLVDRYLIAAELLKIKPVIIINKIDLLTDDEIEHMRQILKPYAHIGYEGLLSSIYLPDGLTAISKCINGDRAVLVGPSGVGKSSIIAKLSQQETLKVGEVSCRGAGKHTTTAIRLYHLPKGGYLIDSPGVREFNLWPITLQALLKGFKDFSPFVADCKFRDCKHIVEPKCAVRKAVEENKIYKGRYESYVNLIAKVKK